MLFFLVTINLNILVLLRTKRYFYNKEEILNFIYLESIEIELLKELLDE